jgi:hypothetical protein
MRASLFLFVILAFGFRHSAKAAVIYSGLQSIPIPTTFTGIYLDLDTAATSSTPSVGWDINPFFGGIGLAGSAAFQPVRVGTGNTDTIRLFAINDLIDSTLMYASGTNGSSDHLGAPGNFQAGTEGYLGFRFIKNDLSGPYYGWMRLTLTSNTSGAYIHDWAWEDNGLGIHAGSLLSIPEPSRALLLMLGITLGFCQKRRRDIQSLSVPA